MDVRINERRRDKPASSINLACGAVGGQHIRDSGESSILYSDINEVRAAMKVRMTDDQVVMHTMILFCIWVQFITPECFKIRGRRCIRLPLRMDKRAAATR